MAFSDFKTVAQVLRKYPLKLEQQRFLPDARLALPDWFVTNLNFALDRKGTYESEQFFRESFVYPYLQFTWQHHQQLQLWINQYISADETLFGEPDYLLSIWPQGVVDQLVNRPLLAVIEAKKQDFEAGWAQCLAAMLACQKINGQETVTIYGIVTTGLLWEFGRLEGKGFVRDPRSYAITTPEQVYALLDFIFVQCEEQLLIPA
ncbi:MAG: hypothetical protein DYG89_33990 [Caldilinea sp. CFX5]|nr:hypothetical protein [Caldilinea sp. CFX5]